LDDLVEQSQQADARLKEIDRQAQTGQHHPRNKAPDRPMGQSASIRYNLPNRLV
jgi:hypothetical protein